MQYRINPSELSGLVERLEKLAARAVKLGVEPLVWTIGEVRRELDPETHEPRAYQYVDVDGLAPRYAGWHFVASIERYGAELIVTTAPGLTLPEGVDRTDTTQSCEHCGLTRDRTTTFVLQHDDGRVVRVGSTCLRDFLGHSFPSVAKLLRDYNELEELEGMGKGAWCADLEEFLAATAMHCEEGGYVSRSNADSHLIMSTADAVLRWYDDAKKQKPTDKHLATARAAIEWARNVNADSDYMQNVAVVARAGFVTLKHAGIAASILRAAELAAERKARDTAAANLAETSRHFGTVGERGTWSATLIGCYTTEGHYGTTWIYKFATSEGNAATWFSSNNAKIDIGTTYWVTGTVKKHDQYRGVSETHLSRCKVSTEPPKPTKPRKRKAAKKPNPNVNPGETVTIEPEREGEVWVWGESVYEESSVLAGETRRRRIEVFASVDAAKAQYPRATVCEHANSAWLNREAARSFAQRPQPDWFDAGDAGESW